MECALTFSQASYQELNVKSGNPITVDIYEDRKGLHRWRIRHTNGNILADSGEGYTRAAYARKAAIKLVSLIKRTSYTGMGLV